MTAASPTAASAGLPPPGPVSNLLLAAALGLLGRWWEPLYLFAGAQLVLGAFNLLPALPLDGGRILWLALAWLTEPYTAQRVLSAVSLAVSLALLLGGGGLIWRLGGSPLFAGGGRGADRMESAGNKACQRGIKRVK